MLRLVMLSVLFMISTAILAETPSDGIDRITVEQLKAMIDKKQKVVIVDVRQDPSVIIRGAVVIPLQEIEKKFTQLPKNSLIVTVCA